MKAEGIPVASPDVEPAESRVDALFLTKARNMGVDDKTILSILDERHYDYEQAATDLIDIAQKRKKSEAKDAAARKRPRQEKRTPDSAMPAKNKSGSELDPVADVNSGRKRDVPSVAKKDATAPATQAKSAPKPKAVSQPTTFKVSKKRQDSDIGIQDIVQAGLMKIGDKVTCHHGAGQPLVGKGRITDDFCIQDEEDQTTHQKPTGWLAHRIVRSKHSGKGNGWMCVKFNGQPLDALRKALM